MKNEIINRFNAPTPSFFKKLARLGHALIATALTVYTLPIEAPEPLEEIAGYILLSGILISTLCQLTITRSPPDDP